MKYTVWLLTRPLSVEAFLAPLSGSSDGRDHLRHWGVLVSEMTLVDAQAIFTRTRGFWDNNDIELGTLYETFRDDQGFQNVHVRHGPLQMATIRNEWRALSFQLVGETDMTHEMIQQEGKQAPSLKMFCLTCLLAIRIIKSRPNFHLFENNCQNFVKFLLEAMCPTAPVPETIRCVIERLLDLSTVARRPGNPLPGTYPPSLAESDCDSFMTASGTSWWTASGTIWITAFECVSSNQSSLSVNTGEPRSRNILFNVFRFPSPRTLAFHQAAAELDDTKIRLLLRRRNLDVSIRDDQGRTALHIAARRGHATIVQLLLDGGFDPSATDIEGRTPVHMAVQSYENTDALQNLLKAGANVLVQDVTGRSALHVAAEHGMVHQMKVLLEAGADVAARDRNGRSTLHLVVTHGTVQQLKILLEAGGDVLAEDNEGMSVIQCALAYGLALEGLKQLLDVVPWRFFPIQEKSTLHFALSRCEPETMKVLFDAGIDPSVLDSKGRSALVKAIEAGNLEVATVILGRKETDTLSQDHDGVTPLHVAARKGDADAIKLLLRFERRGSPKTNDGTLHVVMDSEKNRLDILRLLLDAGVDSSSQNAAGETPLHLALKRRLEPEVQTLLGAHSNLSLRTFEDGYTPLILAVQMELHTVSWFHQFPTRLSEMLLKAGANVSARDDRGWTALHWAAFKLATRRPMVATALLYAINNGDANASEKIRGQLAKRPLGTDDNVFWTLLAAGADFHALDYHGYSPLNILRNPATEGRRE